MKKSISTLLTLISVIILSGCASTYKPINPSTLNYNAHDLQDGIALSYKYDVLRERGNRKYAKKEAKKGVKLIAVKITNNTDSVINVGRDIAFYSGKNQLFLMEPMVVQESIKQNVLAYLPYALLTFVNLSVTNGSSTEIYPIGLALGPAATISNMVIAGTANKNLLDELYDYNILSRDIQKGESVYGIIGVRDIGFSPISVRMIE